MCQRVTGTNRKNSMVLNWNNLSSKINTVALDFNPKHKVNIHVLD